MKIGQFIEYKGYIGSIEYDPDDKIYYGSLQNIKDSISYHAKYGDELLQRYHETVDRYIKFKEDIENGININWENLDEMVD